MPRAQSIKVGQGPCPSVGCGAIVWFRRTRSGILFHKCDACDSSGYADENGAAFTARMASIANPAPPPPEPKAPEAKPAPRARSTARTAANPFNLGNL